MKGTPEKVDQLRYEELVKASINGDRAAQRQIYNALSSKMFALCIRYMGDRMSAEDILQEGFVTLFTKIREYSGQGSFEGWARKIFVNTALMALRRNDALKMSTDLENAWNVGSNQASQLEDIGYKDLLGLVAKLPPGFRTIFNMYVIEGFSHNDIADALNISPGTSRSQLQRARMMLQKMITKNGR